MPPSSDPRNRVGTIIHAVANRVLGDHTARNIFGPVNMFKTYMQGTVVNVFDGRAPGAKNASWKLTVNFEMPNDDPLVRITTRTVAILRQHCTLGPVPAGKNPDCSVFFTDSIGDPDHAVRGSTTYLPDGEARATARAAAAASAANKAVVNNEADDAYDAIIDGSLDAIIAPPVDVETAVISTTARMRRKSARSITPDNLTATPLQPLPPPPPHLLPQPPPPPPAPSRSRMMTTGKRKSAEPVDLRATPLYSVDTECTRHRIVAISHERTWVAGDAKTIIGDIAGEPSPSNRRWYHIGPTGERIGPNDRDFEDMSVLEAFLHMMPPEQLDHMLRLTNERLAADEQPQLVRQELLRWIGVCTLISTINFRGARRHLWEGGGATSKYLPPINLRATGMSRNRFDAIWSAVRWSHQPMTQPDGVSSERYRWMLVEDFVTNFNAYRQRTFVPGGHLEADETIIRWYGIGGGYIDDGLPMYVAMERKPDNGAELQNLADVTSGVMLRLKIVKSAQEERAAAADDDGDNDEAEGGKGTRVLLDLTAPWHDTGRLVTADAYFASVEAALAMKAKGLFFIGNVKQCHKKFPMQFLANTILAKRGSRSVLASISEETGETELVAISWMDRNRRFFIATTYGSGEGDKIERRRLRQLDKSGRAPPDKVMIEVTQPKAVATYYAGAGTIDMHNRIRAAELRMDRNLRTKDWSKRFNFGILGIVCVDAYLFFQQVVHADNKIRSCHEFFGRLADELIDNTEGVRTTRAAVEIQVAEAAAAVAPPTLRWTSRRKKRPNGKEGVSQGRCGAKDCARYTSHVCSACTHKGDVNQRQFWFCNHTTRGGSECFAKHVRDVHGNKD